MKKIILVSVMFFVLLVHGVSSLYAYSLTLNVTATTTAVHVAPGETPFDSISVGDELNIEMTFDFPPNWSSGYYEAIVTDFHISQILSSSPPSVAEFIIMPSSDGLDIDHWFWDSSYNYQLRLNIFDTTTDPFSSSYPFPSKSELLSFMGTSGDVSIDAYIGSPGDDVGGLAAEITSAVFVAPSPVPEPATILLLGSGVIGFAVSKKRKKS